MDHWIVEKEAVYEESDHVVTWMKKCYSTVTALSSANTVHKCSATSDITFASYSVTS